MKKFGRIAALLTCAALCFAGAAGCKGTQEEKFVSVELWHYYTGKIDEAFERYVDKFNNTVGLEKGIVIEAKGQGSVSRLTQNLMDSAEEKKGAEPLPQMFTGYADTAYELNKLAPLAAFDGYIGESERAEFVQDYLAEGRIDGDGVKVLPLAKATETVIVNKTAWDAFAAGYNASKPTAEQVKPEDFDTVEGITALAEKYYAWSGGKALFARDSVDNYMIVGSAQLGEPIVSVDADGKASLNFDKETTRKLWDQYFVPFVTGRFSHWERFGTDCIRNGETIAALGSTSSAGYLPETDKDDKPIELMIRKAPVFAGGGPLLYTQQGAGLCMFAGDKAVEKAAAEFAAWMTREEQNAGFCLMTGYLPVKQADNNYEVLRARMGDDAAQGMKDTLRVACEMIAEADEMYSAPPFSSSNAVRNLFKTDFDAKCKADAKEYAALQGAYEEAAAAYDEAAEKGEAQDKLDALSAARDTAKTAYDAYCGEILSDAYFNSWYSTVKAVLSNLVK